jgi:molecular chaperone GrpE (heat shock protein)
MGMSDPANWKVPKWPFWVIYALLIAFAYYFMMHAPHAIHDWEIAVACVAFGSFIGVIPYYLDYKAMGKALEVNALGAVAEKFQELEELAAKITAVTDQWHVIHDSVGQSAEKTGVAAKEIAEKMSSEVRGFQDFMKKLDNNERSALRLEVEKLRRAELEWVQTLVHVMDHIFALHAAAVRSNQPKVADQISQFQNACRGTVRRVGLLAYVGESDEAFNPERFRLVDPNQKAFDGAIIAETLAPGYTFQGRILRPAGVRLRGETPASAESPVAAENPALVAEVKAPRDETKVPTPAQDDLALEAD